VVLTYIAQKQAAITKTRRLSFQVFFLSFLISFLSLEFFLDFLSTYQFPNPLRAEEPHLGLSTTTKASSAHQLHDFIILIGHCTDLYDPKRIQGCFDSYPALRQRWELAETFSNAMGGALGLSLATCAIILASAIYAPIVHEPPLVTRMASREE